jgi:hypothetical protein
MNAEQVGSLVGRPYANNGCGPEAFNCWGLLRYVQLTYFSRDMGRMPIGNEEETKAQHSENLEIGLYEPVDKPFHGAAVLLRSGNAPHVGVWLEIDGGGVLHSLGNSGVIWTPKSNLNRLGFGRCRYYRINANVCKPDSIERPVPATSQ